MDNVIFYKQFKPSITNAHDDGSQKDADKQGPAAKQEGMQF